MWGPEVSVTAAGLDNARLPPDVEIVLYRIMQEALSNVARHAGASKATVTLTREGGMVTMEVTDDGHGFDVTAALRASGERAGLGLHSMRERAAVVGGTVAFESEPGRGTRVVVEIPLVAETP